MIVVHTESSLGWGGQELRTIFEILGRATRSDWTQTLICSPLSSFHRAPAGVNIIECPIEKKSLKGLYSLNHILQDLQPDIVACHSSTDSWLVILSRLIYRHKFKVVRYRHVNTPLSVSVINRWFYRQFDSIITTSDDIREALVTVYGLNSKSVRAVPTGVDIQKLHSLSRYLEQNPKSLPRSSSSNNVAVTVATLRSWKGHSYLIEAMTKLENWELWVVGDGPQLDSIKNQVLESNLSERVKIYGYQADVIPFMVAADVFIQASYANEGVSQSVLQAMALGKLCAVANISGLNQVIQHLKTGYLFEPKSSEAIINALAYVVDNKTECATLAARAQRVCTQEHSLEQMIKSTTEIFEEIVC